MLDEELVFVGRMSGHHCIGVRFDALALERSVQFNRDARVSVRHECWTRFEQADAAAQIGQDGGDLASGVGRADDGRGRR